MLGFPNPVEFRDSCQDEGACELSFGREVGRVNQAGRARHSREKSPEWSSHQGPRRQRAFGEQKESQEAWAPGAWERAAARQLAGQAGSVVEMLGFYPDDRGALKALSSFKT